VSLAVHYCKAQRLEKQKKTEQKRVNPEQMMTHLMGLRVNLKAN
jgi:hypothetical protein